MKKIFSIFLICCASFAFADDTPVFDEADENECRLYAPVPFAVEAPMFEEEEEEEVADEQDPADSEEVVQDEVSENPEVAQDEPSEDQEVVEADDPIDSDEVACGDGKCDDEGCRFSEGEDKDTIDAQTYALGTPVQAQRFESTKRSQDRFQSSYSRWGRYKSNFGMEKIFIRFPQKPAISQSSSLLTAYAYDHAVLYSFAGYFPPLGNIDPIGWFDEILYNVTDYPYTLVNHSIYQVSNGDWVMDYIAHDYVQNLVIKARAVITPFNGYILQCVKPNGSKDYFNYFLDNFWIKCDCNH